MFNEIYLEPDKVPAHLKCGYAGRKFRVQVCESMTIPADAVTWDEGSRDVYSIVQLSDGRAVMVSDTMSPPWDETRKDRRLTIVPGLCVVRSSVFLGRNTGLTFYLHPTDAAPMLPAPVELTPFEKLVLHTTAGRKSSYNGKDRYELAQEDQRWATTKLEPFPTRAEWDAAKVALAGRGLLTKTGGITPAGRNAAR